LKVGKEGVYSGIFRHGNFSDTISFEIKKDSTDWKVFFTSLEQNEFQIPLHNAQVRGDSIRFMLQSDHYTYDFKNKWIDNYARLSGSLEVDSLVTTYTLKREALSREESVKTEEVILKSNGLKMGGTIRVPAKLNNKGIVFLTSSGSGDRSGSRAEAIYFANKGYTTFHYDKRGTGTSEGNWQAATMEELLSDDVNAIAYFSVQTGIPLSKIGIKGSSQGATKVPYILNELQDLKYGIAVSCPGTTLLESDLNAWKNNNPDIPEEGVELQRKVFKHIAGDLTRTELEKSIELEKSKPWYPDIWIPNLDEVQIDPKLSYSPMSYFQKTKQPILIIQGTLDEIIPENSHELISKALEEAGNDNYKIVELKDANHSMYHAGQTDFPYWAKLHPDFLETIETWINTNSW
ncbi:MAG: prolyl oligopeptidase family serine peptidase, partial [Maribacter sp.]|uniref:alpha/beta hydrolase family protein n=1 Tax=Maribacter sp. TaxID=1897614 RepID=UPI003C767AB7